MDADLWDERYSAREYMWTDTANQFVQAGLDGETPGRALDFGAGEGRNAVWLARRGWEVTAVDFSAVGVDKGRRLAADHDVTVDFQVADVLTWSPDDGTVFDLVVLSYLQLAEPQRSQALARAAGMVGPGGLVFVIAHDQSNVDGGHGGPPSTAVCYSADDTASVFINAGLEIEQAEVVDRLVATAGGDRTALDTLVVARRP